MVYFYIRLLHLINLLNFKEFFSISQIWTIINSNDRIKWVEKWYSCYGVQCEALPRKWKEFLNLLFTKHDHERVAEWFLNYKKGNKVWKTWDLSRSYDIEHGGHGKKWRRFHIIGHIRCLQTEVSQKKNCSIEKDSVGFGVKVMVELGFDFKTFCIGNK